MSLSNYDNQKHSCRLCVMLNPHYLPFQILDIPKITKKIKSVRGNIYIQLLKSWNYYQDALRAAAAFPLV